MHRGKVAMCRKLFLIFNADEEIKCGFHTIGAKSALYGPLTFYQAVNIWDLLKKNGILSSKKQGVLQRGFINKVDKEKNDECCQ